MLYARDINYDGACNTSFHQNIESIQCNAGLAITGAVRGTSREKVYQELGFESPQEDAGIENFVAYSK